MRLHDCFCWLGIHKRGHSAEYTDQNNEQLLLWCHFYWRMRAKLMLAVQFLEYGVIISNTYKMEFSNLLSSRSKNLRRFLNRLCDFYSHQNCIFNKQGPYLIPSKILVWHYMLHIVRYEQNYSLVTNCSKRYLFIQELCNR